MCWCNPNIRTPCCGGPNCHPPFVNPLKVVGTGRVGDNDQVLMISFNRKPTDNELRAFHDHFTSRWWS
jgi:hypothetical protein